MESFDLYEELELSRSAKPEEIKQSYKKLALKWHPDKNKGNEEQATLKFQRISEAYTILSDAQKKERYDKYGTINEEDFDFQDFMSHFDFQDIFGSLFGDLTFNLNSGGFSAFSGSMNHRNRGRAKNKYQTKAQIRREQKEAEKLFKEFSGMGFTSEDKKKSKEEKKDNASDDDWDTEEEYTDDEEDGKGKNGEENDDDFEDVDSSDEEGGNNRHDDDDVFGAQNIFFFPMFMDENTTEIGKKMKCKFDNKVFKNDDDLFEHFNDSHKKEFKSWLKKKT